MAKHALRGAQVARATLSCLSAHTAGLQLPNFQISVPHSPQPCRPRRCQSQRPFWLSGPAQAGPEPQPSAPRGPRFTLGRPGGET